MRAVARFLVSLSEDPFLREDFQTDPEGVLASVELKDEERRILRTGDAVVLRGFFEGVPGRPVPKLQGVIVHRPPGPEPEPEPEPLPEPEPEPSKT